MEGRYDMIEYRRYGILIIFAAAACVVSPSFGEVDERQPRPGARLAVDINDAAFIFRWCPAGKFRMGAAEEARAIYGDRFVPQHDVRFSRGFWLMETEVTQSQFERIIGRQPSFFHSRKNPEHPVEQVSWFDAVEFCDRLLRLDPKNYYRLPTEAEWEYACRAGTKEPRYGELSEIACVFQNTDLGEGSTGHRPVGLKKPNAWGLYDMFGNVGEWCSDWYGPPSLEAVSDPIGPKSGEFRVVRGDDCFADCSLNVPGCLAAARSEWPPKAKERTIGFRVVRVPTK